MLAPGLTRSDASRSAPRGGVAPGRREQGPSASGTGHALVAGDQPGLVDAMAASLPAAGFDATCVHRVMEVAERATARGSRGGGPAYDLIVLVLSRDAWTYVSLVEVLVHELAPVPLVVFTDGQVSFARRLEALGVLVVTRLPFAAEERRGWSYDLSA